MDVGVRLLSLIKDAETNRQKYTPEEAALLSLDEVKAMIETQVPNAFTKAAPKKAAAKKATTTKKHRQKSSSEEEIASLINPEISSR